MLRRSMMTVLCLVAAGTSAWAAGNEPEGSAAPAAKPVIAMQEPQQGDFWTYEVRDEISGKVSAVQNIVTDVTPTEIGIRSAGEGKDTQVLRVFDRSWNLKNAGEWKYQPGDGRGIRTPLKVGDSWNFSAEDVNNSKGHIWKRSGKSKVVGQETVTTKAGTFEAYKIETTLVRRPTSDRTRKNEIASVTWYVPAIDHWVKRTFVSRGNGHLLASNTVELVEYGRKN